MKRKCSMCRSNPGVWPIQGGGKVCDTCKSSIERCENQRGGGGHTVQGCFSQGMRRR